MSKRKNTTVYRSPVFVYEVRYNESAFKDHLELGEQLKGICKKWVIQLEMGESGYVHWQGRISLIKKARKGELMKLMESAGAVVPNFLEPTISKEHREIAFYCMKEATRISDRYYTEKDWKDSRDHYVPRQYRDITLYPWQQTVLNTAKVFDDRAVDCLIDTAGCNGKSTLARVCMLEHDAYMLPCHCDGVKLTQSLCNMLMAKEDRAPSIIFVDMPRAMGKDRLGGLYSAVENIKGGYVADERNSYKEWWFNSPRVWCFTNVAPDTELLSVDRWRLWMIDDDKLVP